ncbi:aspartate carbamoyltransferase [Bacilliculturomica massiliensis]|uniref:aspartate carbamoyltransferase n=1 Tax=Bacilliculturomica massiliensis TaxID=1917867 RepID=UPI0010325818|nr:aspartate carbamoyltransferase [Bacilliculturomica massiliensis]
MVKPLCKSITGIKNLNREDIEYILELAEKLEPIILGRSELQPLKDKTLCTFFYEPSTRTRLSFESAMWALGGRVISMADAQKTSSVWKGETLADTIRTIENYCHIIALRHFEAGAAEEAARISRVPVINAGDGPNEHPTQTLLDMLTIRRERGTLDNLRIVLCGDLKHTRSTNSLTLGMSNFDNVEFTFVRPKGFETSRWILDLVKERGCRYTESEDLQESLIGADVVYMCRIQKERFDDPEAFDAIDGKYCLTREMLERSPKIAAVLHHLPRVKELDVSVDDYPGCAYFRQTYNGVLIRAALMTMLLDREPAEFGL